MNKNFSLGSRAVAQFHQHKDWLCWEANNGITATYQAETHTHRHARQHTRHKNDSPSFAKRHARPRRALFFALARPRGDGEMRESPGKDCEVSSACRYCRSISGRMKVRAATAASATLIPLRVNRCHPAAVELGRKRRRGKSTTTDRQSSCHRSFPSMYLQIQRLGRGRSRKEEGGCRSVKAVG